MINITVIRCNYFGEFFGFWLCRFEVGKWWFRGPSKAESGRLGLVGKIGASRLS